MIKLKINNPENRKALVGILAENGYMTAIVEEPGPNLSTIYYVLISEPTEIYINSNFSDEEINRITKIVAGRINREMQRGLK